MILATTTDSILVDRPLLRDVDTVKELTDILVPYTTETLDRCSCPEESQRICKLPRHCLLTRLGHVLNIDALEDEFVLLGF